MILERWNSVYLVQRHTTEPILLRLLHNLTYNQHRMTTYKLTSPCKNSVLTSEKPFIAVLQQDFLSQFKGEGDVTMKRHRSRTSLLLSSPQCSCCTNHTATPPAPSWAQSSQSPPVWKHNCLPVQQSSFYAHWCRQQCGCGNSIFALIQKYQITQSSITVNVNPQCSAPPTKRSNQLLSKFNTSACQTSAMSTTSGNMPRHQLIEP